MFVYVCLHMFIMFVYVCFKFDFLFYLFFIEVKKQLRKILESETSEQAKLKIDVDEILNDEQQLRAIWKLNWFESR